MEPDAVAEEAVKPETIPSLPSEQEILDRIRAVLNPENVQHMTTKTVRKALEAHFNADLTPLKRFLKESIAQVVSEVLHADGGDAGSDGEDGNGSVKEEDGVKSEGEAGSDVDDSDGEEIKKRKSKGGYGKEMRLSDDLASFLGVETMSRPQVVKALWVYIREHSLQDPSDRRKILLDDKMQAVFKCKTMTMFNMNKKLTAHIKSADDLTGQDSEEDEGDVSNSDGDDDAAPARGKRKAKAEAIPPPKKKATKKKPKDGDDPAQPKGPLMRLSEHLAAVVGTNELQRTQVVKKLWEYIREHDLQNPDNKREILCDDKLKLVMGQDMVTMFSMNKCLSAHILGKVM